MTIGSARCPQHRGREVRKWGSIRQLQAGRAWPGCMDPPLLGRAGLPCLGWGSGSRKASLAGLACRCRCWPQAQSWALVMVGSLGCLAGVLQVPGAGSMVGLRPVLHPVGGVGGACRSWVLLPPAPHLPAQCGKLLGKVVVQACLWWLRRQGVARMWSAGVAWQGLRHSLHFAWKRCQAAAEVSQA